MSRIKCHRLALVFALISFIVSPLDTALAKAYPDWGARLYYHNGRSLDETTAIQSGIYRGYTVRERTRAGVRLMGFAFCLLAFFFGRAGVKRPQGRERDISIIAAIMGLCSSAYYGGTLISLLLFLVFMLRLQQKEEISAEQSPIPESP
ncbi:MAG: hypothetical protein LIQ30_13635 [Planctomycetes bacterium]|nr:hypothetical protein [Planctomycetota bacterium]MCC8115935.1 hypothetical protein [Planctomycetota bacterium]